MKIDGPVVDKKTSFKMLGLSFSSKLNRGSYISSIAKTGSTKIRDLIHSMRLFSPEVALCFYNFAIRPYMEYCCHVWIGAPSCYLAYRQNASSLSIFHRNYFGRCSCKLTQLVPFSHSHGWSTHYSYRLYDSSATICRCYEDVYVINFIH